MNILDLIAGNFRRGPESHYPDRPVPGSAYRGRVVMAPDRCLACGICASVCVSAAIDVQPGERSATWAYDPSSCTFCGACVSHCPVAALTQEADRGEACHRAGEQAVTLTVDYPTCTGCGAPTLPTNAELLDDAYGARAEQLRDRAQLCERCRLRVTVEGMRKAFGAAPETTDTRRSGHGQ